MSEQRHIRKIVRKEKEAQNPFPDVPAGMMRRGAITTQKVETTRDYSPHSKPRAVEGFVTLSELAAKAGIQAQLARLWLKKAEIKKPKDGWRWKVDSRELTRVRKVLDRVLTQEPT